MLLTIEAKQQIEQEAYDAREAYLDVDSRLRDALVNRLPTEELAVLAAARRTALQRARAAWDLAKAVAKD